MSPTLLIVCNGGRRTQPRPARTNTYPFYRRLSPPSNNFFQIGAVKAILDNRAPDISTLSKSHPADTTTWRTASWHMAYLYENIPSPRVGRVWSKSLDSISEVLRDNNTPFPPDPHAVDALFHPFDLHHMHPITAATVMAQAFVCGIDVTSIVAS